MWVKRLLLVFCLFSCLFRLSATPSFYIDWSKVDNSLNMLEANLNEAGTTIQLLQKDLEEQHKFSANQQIQYKTLEDKYLQLEKTTKRWKTVSMIFIGSTVVIGVIALWQK